MSSVIEIEVDGPDNGNLFFLPFGRPVRGRLDFLRVREANARVKVDQFPNGIPGQRIRFNPASGTASVVEPLHDQEHARTRETVEARGYKLDPPQQEITADTPTVLYWARRAVESGSARVIKGEFPKEEEAYRGARKRFLSPEPKRSGGERMQAAVTAFMMTKMTKQEREEFKAFLADFEG